MAVKINLLSTSDRHRFGRSWVYQHWHETEEALQPDYWVRALRKVRRGDFVKLVRMDDKNEVVEVTETVVTKTSRGGIGLTVLHRHPIHREEAPNPVPADVAPPPAAERRWSVGRKRHVVFLYGEEVAAYEDRETADAMVADLLASEAA